MADRVDGMLAKVPQLAGWSRCSELQQALQVVKDLLTSEQVQDGQTSAAGRCRVQCMLTMHIGSRCRRPVHAADLCEVLEALLALPGVTSWSAKQTMINSGLISEVRPLASPCSTVPTCQPGAHAWLPHQQHLLPFLSSSTKINNKVKRKTAARMIPNQPASCSMLCSPVPPQLTWVQTPP